MGLSGAVLLLGNLHFVDPEWAGLANSPGVEKLKVREWRAMAYPLLSFHVETLPRRRRKKNKI